MMALDDVDELFPCASAQAAQAIAAQASARRRRMSTRFSWTHRVRRFRDGTRAPFAMLPQRGASSAESMKWMAPRRMRCVGHAPSTGRQGVWRHTSATAGDRDWAVPRHPPAKCRRVLVAWTGAPTRLLRRDRNAPAVGGGQAGSSGSRSTMSTSVEHVTNITALPWPFQTTDCHIENHSPPTATKPT